MYFGGGFFGCSRCLWLLIFKGFHLREQPKKLSSNVNLVSAYTTFILLLQRKKNVWRKIRCNKQNIFKKKFNLNIELAQSILKSTCLGLQKN